MPNFIQCLRQDHEDLDAEALRLYGKADNNARKAAEKNGKKDYAADEVATELDKLITAQIEHQDLDGNALRSLHKKNLDWFANVENWAPEKAGQNMGKCAALQQVRNGVVEMMLEKVLSPDVEVLKSACDQYIAHLKGIMRLEGAGEMEQHELLQKDGNVFKSDNQKLNTAAAQYNAVCKMLKALDTDKSAEEKINDFQNAYSSNKKIIERSRDSAADIFLKCVNSVLKFFTGKLSEISGLWQTKEKSISSEIQDVLPQQNPKKGG